ncbi:ATP-dependent Clp protease proteolytic subunit [Hymenobacter chitinivorans]|nr:ATP-dependent Clp protease proteolytic subunit [Hymenobacter chitinivorans]
MRAAYKEHIHDAPDRDYSMRADEAREYGLIGEMRGKE